MKISQPRCYFSNRGISKLLLNEFYSLNRKDLTYKILDLGCGDGVLLEDLKDSQILHSNFNIKAVDIDSGNIEIAKKRGYPVKFQVMDAQMLKFNKNTFNLIFSWMVLEHVFDPQKMVDEIFRVLKPKGRCYLSTIMKKPWAIYFYWHNGGFVLDPTHTHEFKSKAEFLKLFKKKFKVVEFRKEMRWYPVLELILKVLIRIGFLKQSISIRNIFLKNPFLNKLNKLIVLPVFGFYQFEVVVEKI